MGIETILKIAAIGLVTALVNNILDKSDKKEISTLVTITGLLIVIMMVIDMISGLFSSLSSIFNLF